MWVFTVLGRQEERGHFFSLSQLLFVCRESNVRVIISKGKQKKALFENVRINIHRISEINFNPRIRFADVSCWGALFQLQPNRLALSTIVLSHYKGCRLKGRRKEEPLAVICIVKKRTDTTSEGMCTTLNPQNVFFEITALCGYIALAAEVTLCKYPY